MNSRTRKIISGLKRQKVLANFFNLSIIQVSNVILLSISFPIITLKIGIEYFGIFAFANTFSTVAAAFVNYGTTQSGIRDVASSVSDKAVLNKIINNIIIVKIFIFLLYIATLIVLFFLDLKFYKYVFWAFPIVLAEVLNPLFFYTGVEKLSKYSKLNLISKIAGLVLILIFVNSSTDTVKVNFILGISSCICFSYLLASIFFENKFDFKLPEFGYIKLLVKENFHLTISNCSGQLQQAAMIFLLARIEAPLVLGAYSLCDKIVSSVRMILVSLSMAIYPKSVQLFNQSVDAWNTYKRHLTRRLTFFIFIVCCILFLFSDYIIYLLTGAFTEIASNYLKMAAFIPLLATLNALNVIELLIRRENKVLSSTAIFFAFFSVALAYTVVKLLSYKWIGIYAISIELISLIVYLIIIERLKIKWQKL